REPHWPEAALRGSRDRPCAGTSGSPTTPLPAERPTPNDSPLTPPNETTERRCLYPTGRVAKQAFRPYFRARACGRPWRHTRRSRSLHRRLRDRLPHGAGRLGGHATIGRGCAGLAPVATFVAVALHLAGELVDDQID